MSTPQKDNPSSIFFCDTTFLGRALGLKPRYARGWLNLGIAHANLGRPKASVRAYLRALELSPQADHIWNYIRIALRWEHPLGPSAGQAHPACPKPQRGRQR